MLWVTSSLQHNFKEFIKGQRTIPIPNSSNKLVAELGDQKERARDTLKYGNEWFLWIQNKVIKHAHIKQWFLKKNSVFKFKLIINKGTKNTHSKRDRLKTKIFPCSGGALRSLGRAKIKTKSKYFKCCKNLNLRMRERISPTTAVKINKHVLRWGLKKKFLLKSTYLQSLYVILTYFIIILIILTA